MSVVCSGTTQCTAASGLFCTFSTSTCPLGDTCTNLHGTDSNTIDCKCGTTACNKYNGMFCYLPDNNCQASPDPLWVADCTNTDNTAVNSHACVCGSVVCLTESNGNLHYCNQSTSTCGCSPSTYKINNECHFQSTLFNTYHLS